VYAATVFIGGVFAHAAVAHRPLMWIAGAVLAAALAATRFDHARISSAAIAVATFSVAVASAQLAAFYFPRHDIAAFVGDEQRIAKIELTLDRPLRLIGTQQQHAGVRPMPPKQVTTARVVRVLTKSGWEHASGDILVTLEPPNEKLAMGQTIRVCGMLQRPPPAMNPGAFDWQAYYREQRILTQLSIPHADGVEIVHFGRPSFIASARESVRRALAAGFTEEQSLDHALLRALVLGDTDPELRDVQEQFRRTGTSHHLAISGMHVAILGMVIYGICRVLRVRPRVTVIVATCFVVAYGVVALPSPSVIRSVMLCAAFGLGIALGRSHDNLQLLAVSVLAMLVYHPLDLYNAGFQLSFGTVLGLILFHKLVFGCLGGEPTADERAALSTARPERRLVWVYRARRWCLAIMTPSLVAWAVSMPLIGFHFSQLNPWAVLGSIVLAPVVFVALVGGFLKIILTALLPFGAAWWATAASYPIEWMRWSVDVLGKLPGNDVPLPTRSLLFIFLYYVLLTIPLLSGFRPYWKRTLRVAPGLAVLLFALIPLAGGATSRPRDGSLRLTLLAVGAGQCCVMEMPDGRVVVLDAGASITDPVRKCIAPFLRSRGRMHVDELWLSHGDLDHTGAAAELIRAFGVPRVVTSTEFDEHAPENPSNEQLIETTRDRNVSVQRFKRSEQAAVARNVTLDVLWPPEKSPGMNSNNDGLVLKLTYARRTILFPADIQQPALSALLHDSRDALRCDVLVAPHHGSSEAATALFVKAADPLYIVSSNDRTLSQKQRAFEKLISGRPLFRTSQCGAITIEIDRNGGVIVTPFLPPPS
jgi:competence protein ComEC